MTEMEKLRDSFMSANDKIRELEHENELLTDERNELARRISGSAYDLALHVWFVARGSNGAGQFVNDHMKGVQCREDFDLFWRDPHAYYKKAGQS